MSVIYCTATSLDGFIADDDSSLSWLFRTPGRADDPEGGDEPATLDFDALIGRVGAVVMGANTVEWLRNQFRLEGKPFAWPYDQPSWVLTHRDMGLPDGPRRFAGDVQELHPKLLEEAGERDIWVVGGGDVAGQFADAGLLDRVWVHLTPVTLGAGAPLLPRRLRLHRERVERDGQFTAMLFAVVGEEPRDPQP